MEMLNPDDEPEADSDTVELFSEGRPQKEESVQKLYIAPHINQNIFR